MYTPSSFQVDDQAVLLDLMNRYSFATLVSVGEGGLMATHLPFMVERDSVHSGRLVAHMARANQQWRSFDGLTEVLVCFLGPHAYVSPSWYEDPVTVPTWNYAAVHVYGVPRVMTDLGRLRRHVQELSTLHESYIARPWDVANAEEIMDSQLKAVVGFEISISRIEGKFKLSQNRSMADRLGVAAALEEEPDSTKQAVAALMRAQVSD